MKINKLIIKSTFSVLALGTLAACTANYENLNRSWDEVTPEETERDGYNIAAALGGMQSWVVPTDINTCQFTDLLLAGSWGGYFADSKDGFNGAKFSTFDAPDGWVKVMFADILPKVYSNQYDLKNATTDPVPLALGDITRVASLHRVTDTYGPIPYSKMGENGELQSPYDSQKDVYTHMFAELDAAIAVLTANRTVTISANADKVYGGNILKWIQYANSLKLRLAMRVVYADPAMAQKHAEESVNHEVGVITDNSGNAALTSFGKDGNPFYKVMYEYGGGDSRVGADITSYMNGYSDPRCSAYFTASTFATPTVNGYLGLRSGIIIPATATSQKYTNYKSSPSTPLQWMNAAEVAFLRAEGALRGWNMGGSAESFYRSGVTLSFAQWGAADVDAYLANSTATPAAYKDPLGTFNYSGETSNITVAWAEGAGFEKNLERIITQKWIANFTLSHEAWAEYRRTGYPKLMPVVTNNSKSQHVNSAKGARRLAYPQEEYTGNTKNVQDAVSTMLGGPDNMATNIWWDCKK